MPSSSCIKPNNGNPSTGAGMGRFPPMRFWAWLVLIIALPFAVGLDDAIAGEMATHAGSKQTCLTKTTNDPSYMAAVERVTAIPIVKNWTASLGGGVRMAVGRHIDKTELVKGYCYWSISLYESDSTRLLLWKVFRVGIKSNNIYVMDDEENYLPVKITREEFSPNWLEKIFPSVTKCTPDSFYYDKNTKHSNDGILEKLGYSPYKIDDYVARYGINENFHGLSATEIAIPSGTDSVYAVTVSSGVRDLSDAIHKKTGKRLQIYNQGFKAKSGVAYLISDDKQKTSFVCFTFQG